MLTVENWSAPMSQGDALHEVYATVTLNLQLNQVYFFIDVIPSPDACFFSQMQFAVGKDRAAELMSFPSPVAIFFHV